MTLVRTGSGPQPSSQAMANTRLEDIVARTGSGWKSKRRGVRSIRG